MLISGPYHHFFGSQSSKDYIERTQAPPPAPTMTQTAKILKFRAGAQPEAVEDLLAVEAPLQISIRQGGKQRRVSITMRTPGEDVALALGFLYTEGILPAELRPGEWEIDHQDELKNHLVIQLPGDIHIDWQRLSRNTYTSSSCGVCGKTSIDQVFTNVPWPEAMEHPLVDPKVITTLPDRLRDAQILFKQTGGIHACGLFTVDGSLIDMSEDVGRHNALDKLLGKYWMSKILPIHSNVLVLSGRASFELLQKSAMAGISVVVAVGAPSSLAVDLAQEFGITLCGFTKSNTFNCYSGAQRIRQ
jgi:FdhD protein